MSIKNITYPIGTALVDAEPCTSNYNLRCKNIAVCEGIQTNNLTSTGANITNLTATDIQTQNINTVTINGNPFANPVGQARQVLVRDALNVPEWNFISRPNFNLAGNPNNILHLDALGALEFTNTIVQENITVNTLLTSTVDNELDNVNIISNLEINSVAPVANQILGTDGLGVLGWQTPPLLYNTPSAMFVGDALQDFGSGGLGNVLFSTAVYNNITGCSWNAGTSTIDFSTDIITYEVVASIGVAPSASDVDFSLQFDGSTITSQEMSPTSSSITLGGIFTTGVGNFQLRVIFSAIGLDVTPKLAYSGTSSWIKISRIA